MTIRFLRGLVSNALLHFLERKAGCIAPGEIVAAQCRDVIPILDLDQSLPAQLSLRDDDKENGT